MWITEIKHSLERLGDKVISGDKDVAHKRNQQKDEVVGTKERVELD